MTDTPILDTFDGSGSLAAPWSGPVVPGGGLLAKNAGAAGSPGGFRGQCYGDEEFSDVEVHATLEFAPGGFGAFLYARWDPVTISGYYVGANVYSSGESDLAINKLVNGSGVGDFGYTFNSFPWGSGDRMRIRVVAGDLEAWRRPLGGDWELVLSSTDDDPIASGLIAIGTSVIPMFADFGGGAYPYVEPPPVEDDEVEFPFGAKTTESALDVGFRRFKLPAHGSVRR